MQADGSFRLEYFYGIYIALTVIEFVLLLFGGMPVFDSLLHTFGTAGTGGFGIKNSSVAYYNSAYIDYVIGIFMMLFGLNFNVYFLIIARKFSQIKSNDEVKWYIGMMIGAAVIIALNIMPMYHGFGRSVQIFILPSVVNYDNDGIFNCRLCALAYAFADYTCIIDGSRRVCRLNKRRYESYKIYYTYENSHSLNKKR